MQNISWWQDFPSCTANNFVEPHVLGSLFDPEPWAVRGPETLVRGPETYVAQTFGSTLASFVASLVVGIDGEEDWVLKLANYGAIRPVSRLFRD